MEVLFKHLALKLLGYCQVGNVSEEKWMSQSTAKDRHGMHKLSNKFSWMFLAMPAASLPVLFWTRSKFWDGCVMTKLPHQPLHTYYLVCLSISSSQCKMLEKQKMCLSWEAANIHGTPTNPGADLEEMRKNIQTCFWGPLLCLAIQVFIFLLLTSVTHPFVRFRTCDPGAHVSLSTYLVVYHQIYLAVVPRTSVVAIRCLRFLLGVLHQENDLWS